MELKKDVDIFWLPLHRAFGTFLAPSERSYGS